MIEDPLVAREMMAPLPAERTFIVHLTCGHDIRETNVVGVTPFVRWPSVTPSDGLNGHPVPRFCHDCRTLSMAVSYYEVDVTTWRECPLCKVPIASGTCPHIEEFDGRIIMSKHSWERLLNRIQELAEQLAQYRDPE